MKCFLCPREARGFGYLNGRYALSDARRYPLDWVFCSMRCQAIFHHRVLAWREAATDAADTPLEMPVDDPTAVERAAFLPCLKAFAQVAQDIGFDKPLSVYSEQEALRVIEAIVCRYVRAMVEHHAASRCSAVLCHRDAPTPHPLLNNENYVLDI